MKQVTPQVKGIKNAYFQCLILKNKYLSGSWVYFLQREIQSGGGACINTWTMRVADESVSRPEYVFEGKISSSFVEFTKGMGCLSLCGKFNFDDYEIYEPAKNL